MSMNISTILHLAFSMLLRTLVAIGAPTPTIGFTAAHMHPPQARPADTRTRDFIHWRRAFGWIRLHLVADRPPRSLQIPLRPIGPLQIPKCDAAIQSRGPAAFEWTHRILVHVGERIQAVADRRLHQLDPALHHEATQLDAYNLLLQISKPRSHSLTLAMRSDSPFKRE